MDITQILAQTFGLYFLIGGIAVLVRKNHFLPVVGSFAEDRTLRVVVGLFELFFGLLLISLHNFWGTPAEIIVSLTAWVLTLEGIVYLFFPEDMVEDILKKSNIHSWYISGGLVAIVLGLYLLSGTLF